MHIQFIETATFNKSREQWLPKEKFKAMEAVLLSNPEAGDLMVGTGDCRKLRWKRQGMGKLGSIRAIYTISAPAVKSTCLPPTPKTSRKTLPKPKIRIKNTYYTSSSKNWSKPHGRQIISELLISAQEMVAIEKG